MNTLNDYINFLIEKTKDLSDEEAKRFIYIDLCETMSFDINYAGASESTKREIYRNSIKNDVMENYFNKKTGLCTTISIIFERVLKLRCPNINIETIMDIDDEVNRPHAYNIEVLEDGTKVIYDLQQDFNNIKTRSFPEHYAINVETGNSIYSRFDLEQIDRKLGYIDSENYYSDDYMYLVKSDMDLFDNFQEKADFIIRNLEPIYDKSINYLERKWHHEKLIKQYFTEEERKKIKQVDCCFMTRNGRMYTPCIYVKDNDDINIYWFNELKEQYSKISIEDMAIKVCAGLYCYPKIPGLKEAVYKRELDDAR